MSNNKKQKNNFPFANEIKRIKEEFKQMIDKMSDEDFMEMISFLAFSSENIEDSDWCCDEGWEDEAERFYNQGNIDSNNFNFIDDDNLPL